MLRGILGLVVLAVGATVALAENTAAIKERQQLMKANSAALKEPGAMAKGQAPFDLAKVNASLETLQKNAIKLKALWPNDSKTGADTRALPKIWSDMKGFLDWFDGLANDAKTAAAAIKDEASFKAEWPKVVGYCGGCHKDFRAPKKK